MRINAEEKFIVIKKDDSLLAIQVLPERVLAVCEKLENGFYGFMLEILDDEDTILGAGGRMASKDKCNEWKIYKNCWTWQN